jgi:TPR repeat protein
VRVLCAVLLVSALLAGCKTAPTPPPPYEPLAESAKAGQPVTVDELRAAFLADAAFNERMQKLAPLERQAMQLLEDEPLRLGAIGAAILDVYYGSVAGHYAMEQFYEHVDAPDATATHQHWLDEITRSIEAHGNGTRESPYPVISASEAQAFLRVRGYTPEGSMYHSSDAVPFMMLISARKAGGTLESTYFDLTEAYRSVRDSVQQQSPEQRFSPGVLIGYLAQQEDSAAQASIGAYLMGQDNPGAAAEWLNAASRTGNVLANLLLARLQQERSEGLEGAERTAALDAAMDQYLHAIAVGSDEAMFSLGGLYLDGAYGDENIPSGVTLLKQAGDAGNPNALLFLGHMYEAGLHVEQNLDTGADYLRRAAVRGQSLGDTRGTLQYARFLAAHADTRPFDAEAITWLQTAANDESSEAMLLLGNLYARGYGVSQSYRKALSWFKSAVSNAPNDPDIVNEVAWTLTVTELKQLRNARYARAIMDRVMTADGDARNNPAFLDTWAAAHAATGDFERAIALQQEALKEAESRDQKDVLDVLKDHLEAFQRRETLTDPVP